MSSYRYFQVGRFFVCLDQPVFESVRRIGFGRTSRSLPAIGPTRKVRQAAIKAVVKSRLWPLDSRRIIELPVIGHIAMKVHRGHKVFDFEKMQVIKIFSSDCSAEDINAEIEASKLASQVAAAPRFVSQDPGYPGYREEYINGIMGTDPKFRSGRSILEFYPDVECCLLDLIGCKPPATVAADVHIGRLADESFRGRWSAAGLDEGEAAFVSDYIERLRAWLLDQGESIQLQLVLTHGDFSLVNAIATRDGLRFIDWEGVALGCVFSDALNFLFVEQYYGRETEDFANEFDAFIERFRVACRERYPELRAATDVHRTVARRQYYLERLSLLLEREPTENLSNVVRKSIGLFEKFDRESGDSAV